MVLYLGVVLTSLSLVVNGTLFRSGTDISESCCQWYFYLGVVLTSVSLVVNGTLFRSGTS